MTNHELLAENYIFYERYHKNFINKLVHLFCIPILVWTSTVFFSLIPFKYGFNSDIYLVKPIEFNVATIIGLLYCSYYFYLDYDIGKIFLLLFAIFLYTSNLFLLNYDPLIAVYMHIGSWILQILSHKFIEGNQPALLSGIIQSFTMAPFFVYLEFLFLFKKRSDIMNSINEVKKKE